MKKTRKLLAITASLALVLALLPATVFAATPGYQKNLQVNAGENGTAEITLMRGDLDKDGDVDDDDIDELRGLATDPTQITPEKLLIGDISGDGAINSADVTMALRVSDNNAPIKDTVGIYDVEAKPNRGYIVKSAIYNGTSLHLPVQAGQEKVTYVGDATIYVKMEANNTLLLTGIPSGTTNVVQTLNFTYASQYVYETNLKVSADKGGTAKNTFMMGDFDNNGKIDADDLQVFTDILMGAVNPTQEQIKKADFNGNGIVDSADQTYMNTLLSNTNKEIEIYTVENTVKRGYKLKSITYEGETLNLPAKDGETAETTITSNGAKLVVTKNKNGTYTVTGIPNGTTGVEQKIEFAHTATGENNGGSSTSTGSENNATETNSPQTGDSTNMILLGSLLAVSLLAAVCSQKRIFKIFSK